MGSKPFKILRSGVYEGQGIGKIDCRRDFCELWARSYAQYVVTRSGDVELLRQLDVRRATDTGPYMHWTEAEFAPIAKATDELFEKRGWRP
jgi:hypothetical protein